MAQVGNKRQVVVLGFQQLVIFTQPVVQVEQLAKP
jgi:hypothetical protein